MMKQQPSAIKMSPSKLCRLLLLAVLIKLALLGLLIFEPIMPGMVPGFSGLTSADGSSAGRAAANAATGAGAGASPSIEATLPDSGMNSSSPGTASPMVAPGAAPGITAPAGGSQGQPPVLPPIGARPAAVDAGATNGESLDVLARRQEDLARREQELRGLENDLSNRLEQMKILENRLALMMKDAEETKDAKFRHLVDVLSNMKAKQAAAVLETLDPKIAVRVLAGMRGRQAGEILTFVKAERAAHLTEALAHMQLPLD